MNVCYEHTLSVCEQIKIILIKLTVIKFISETWREIFNKEGLLTEVSPYSNNLNANIFWNKLNF